MPSTLKLAAIAAVVGTSYGAPITTAATEEARRLQEPFDFMSRPNAQGERNHPAAGDMLMMDSGYMGGPVVKKPEQAGPAAGLDQFGAEGLVASTKYSFAGLETAIDFATVGQLNEPGNPVLSTVGRFNELGQDTVQDFSYLAQGGEIDPSANMNQGEKQKSQ